MWFRYCKTEVCTLWKYLCTVRLVFNLSGCAFCSVSLYFLLCHFVVPVLWDCYFFSVSVWFVHCKTGSHSVKIVFLHCKHCGFYAVRVWCVYCKIVVLTLSRCFCTVQLRFLRCQRVVLHCQMAFYALSKCCFCTVRMWSLPCRSVVLSCKTGVSARSKCYFCLLNYGVHTVKVLCCCCCCFAL